MLFRSALKVRARDGALLLSWGTASSGGAAIDDYRVQYSTNGRRWTTFVDGVSTERTATITGLRNGTKYFVRVAAVNVAGPGSPSRIGPVSPVRRAPRAPRLVAVVPGDSALTLAWLAPVDDGGLPVVDYVIEYRRGTGRWMIAPDEESTGTSGVITGLTNGKTYSVRVRAANDAGIGVASVSVSVKPVALTPS